MADKIYINGIVIKEWGQYGSMNVSIKVDDLMETLSNHAKNGWLNITIHKCSEPNDKGITHYTVLDEYEPGNR